MRETWWLWLIILCQTVLLAFAVIGVLDWLGWVDHDVHVCANVPFVR